jgi:hypothetical protein
VIKCPRGDSRPFRGFPGLSGRPPGLFLRVPTPAARRTPKRTPKRAPKRADALADPDPRRKNPRKTGTNFFRGKTPGVPDFFKSEPRPKTAAAPFAFVAVIDFRGFSRKKPRRPRPTPATDSRDRIARPQSRVRPPHWFFGDPERHPDPSGPVLTRPETSGPVPPDDFFKSSFFSEFSGTNFRGTP